MPQQYIMTNTLHPISAKFSSKTEEPFYAVVYLTVYIAGELHIHSLHRFALNNANICMSHYQIDSYVVLHVCFSD